MGKEANTSSNKLGRKPHFQLSEVCRKWGRIGLIAGITAAIAIVFCLRPDRRQILLGSLAFVAGSVGVLLTEGWKKRKWLKWMRVIFIPIILAVGGLLTTHGWNARDNYLRDRALLVAVATEWQRNADLMPQILSLRDIYDTSDHKLLITEFLLPTAQESRDALIHSSSIHRDVILVRWLRNYYRVTDQFALALQDIRRVCSDPLATTEMKNSALKQVFETRLIFEYFRQGHRHLGEFLDVNYNWAVREAKARMDMTEKK